METKRSSDSSKVAPSVKTQTGVRRVCAKYQFGGVEQSECYGSLQTRICVFRKLVKRRGDYLKVYCASASSVNFYISQVAGHALFVVRRAVVFAERVENAPRRSETLGEIAKGVHGNGVAAGRQALDGAIDTCWRVLLCL